MNLSRTMTLADFDVFEFKIETTAICQCKEQFSSYKITCAREILIMPLE